MSTLCKIHTVLTVLVLLILLLGSCHATSRSPHEIVGETIGYSRWRTIIERTIRMPNGNLVDFDLVGLAGATSAVMIFAWDSTRKTATLVREYHPGPDQYLVGMAAGIVEEDKHNGNSLTAAQHELEEECHLAGGEWYLLTPQPLAMDKYSLTRARAYLVLDAKHVPDPRPQDDEEDIEILSGVTIEEIENMIQGGEMNLVGVWGCLLAMKKLRELGEID